jgi:hypothetical protein
VYDASPAVDPVEDAESAAVQRAKKWFAFGVYAAFE